MGNVDLKAYVQSFVGKSFGHYKPSDAALKELYGEPTSAVKSTEFNPNWSVRLTRSVDVTHKDYYEDGKLVAKSQEGIPIGPVDDFDNVWTYNQIDDYKTGLTFIFNKYGGNSIFNEKLDIQLFDNGPDKAGYNGVVDLEDTIRVGTKKMTIKEFLDTYQNE